MKRSIVLSAVLTFIPVVSSAQQSVQSFGVDFITFINTTLLPFLFSIALVVFIYYTVRYFIIDVNDMSGKERARNYAIYSIFAFVLMVSVWGIVNLLVAGTGLGRSDVVCPDVVPDALCGAYRGSGSSAPVISPTPAPRPSTISPSASGNTTNTSSSAVLAEKTAAYETSMETVSTELIDNLLLAAGDNTDAQLDAVDTHDSLMAVLEDPNSSDEAKVGRLQTLYTDEYISEATYTESLNTLNELRAAKGEPQIFPITEL